MADKDKKEDKNNTSQNLGCLEEDDEFEEFPVEEWADNKDSDDQNNVWEDNWDDDTVEQDFSAQLRAQLEAQKK